MRSAVNHYLLLSAVCLLLHCGVFGQSPPNDSLVQLAESRAIAFYHEYTGVESPLYYGRLNVPYDPKLKGSPYFQSAEIADGSVWYDHQPYSGIPMQYDQVRDQLIVEGLNGYLIVLYNDRVGEFTLYGHRFIFLSRAVPDGFYDLLESGKVTIYAKREKKIEESITGDEIIHTIAAKDFFYAVRDGQFHSCGSQKSLLSLLVDRKKEIKTYMRSNRIRFKKNPEQAILKITAYYNQLFP
jgi:hypothetical protein